MLSPCQQCSVSVLLTLGMFWYVLWCWVNDTNYCWDTCSLLVLPWWTFASSEGTDGLGSAPSSDVEWGYLQGTPQVGFAPAGSVSGLQLSLLLHLPKYHPLLCHVSGALSFCSVLRNPRVLFCMRKSMYSNDKKGYSQKKDLCVINSLQICK